MKSVAALINRGGVASYAYLDQTEYYDEKKIN